MLKCHICENYFENNLGGQLTNHLFEEHGVSLKDWVIATEFNGSNPVCVCGFCDEMPEFYRGRFRKYARGHKKLEFRRAKFVERYGFPICKSCGKETGFRNNRIEPINFCSFVCSGSKNGFSIKDTQDKIKIVIKEKYGVENILCLPENKEKSNISKAIRFANGVKLTDETKNKISLESRKHWQNEEYAKKVKLGVKIAANRSEERERRKNQAIENFKNNPEWKNKFINSGSGRKSKLHMKIRKLLDLESLGFESEIRIGRYFVDELNKDASLIIEINGNYIHANPKIYKEDDIIRLRNCSYSAAEKWQKDFKRIEFLKSIGYDVFVIWENDNIDEIKISLLKLLNKNKEKL